MRRRPLSPGASPAQSEPPTAAYPTGRPGAWLRHAAGTHGPDCVGQLPIRIERASRIGWPTLAIVGTVVLVVLACVWLNACTTPHGAPLTLRQQIDRLDTNAC